MLRAAMPRAIDSVRRAISACRRSTIRPLSWIAPLPAFSGRSKASMIAGGAVDFGVGGREHRVADVDLAGVDERLAVEAHVAPLQAFGPEPVQIGDVVIDAIDNVDAMGAGGRDAEGEPGGHRGATGGQPRPRLLGEIVEPHDQHFQPRAGSAATAAIEPAWRMAIGVSIIAQRRMRSGRRPRAVRAPPA